MNIVGKDIPFQSRVIPSCSNLAEAPTITSRKQNEECIPENICRADYGTVTSALKLVIITIGDLEVQYAPGMLLSFDFKWLSDDVCKARNAAVFCGFYTEYNV